MDQKTIYRVWDLPIRLCHWLLALSVIAAFICIKFAGTSTGWIASSGIDWMEWHFFFGLSTLTLIIFRILWGFFGSYYARFNQFIKGPKNIFSYLKGHYITLGHNPLGAFSVIAMLLIFGFQAVSGLFTTDDYLYEGPLAHLSNYWSSTLTSLHHKNEPIMIILFALHLLAIFFYRFALKNNLLKPMITGFASAPKNPSVKLIHVEQSFSLIVKAIILFIISFACVYWLNSLGMGAGDFSF